MNFLRVVGKSCKRHRKRIGYTQKQVAQDTCYSVKTISSFETGHLNNAVLLLWYVNHGLTIDEGRVRTWQETAFRQG